MEDEHALPIGTLLAGEYRIDGILGAGGFGITYRARDVKLDIDVAIKEYFPRDFASRSNTVTVRPRSKSEVEQFTWGLSQFIEEARRLARLQHPNIVRCMRYFEENDTGYFVMTFEEGRTLEKYFSGPPQQGDLDRLLEPLLNALEALHAAGIYHRDISPDNILVRDDDTPVLIDFGASRQALARRTQTVAAIVKPGYSPIEQYDRETRQQGAWSDIYALGATLYDIIAGGPPPEAISRVRNDTYVSARQAARGAYRGDFLDAIDWALEPDPDHRPVTVREWRRKLLPNPSRRPAATAATRFEPGSVKTLATRFFGKDGGKKPAGTASRLRWPDYVLRGAALVMLAVFLARTFMSGETTTDAAPEPVIFGDAEERRLLADDKSADAIWKRVELVLRRLGYLRGVGIASISDIRTSLKGYQHAIGQAQTGMLNQQTLNRLLDEPIELDPYTVPGAAVYGRWFLEKNQDGCRMTAGATRIEGRTAVTERPFMEFGRKRDYETDTFDIGLVNPPAVFDVASPLSMSAGASHQILKYDGTDVIMNQDASGHYSRDVTRTLRRHHGEVAISGASVYGGTLKITFPTEGFESAFRAMAAECGEGITYWIDDWGAVVQDTEGTLWHLMPYGTEEEAKRKAMEACTAESKSGGCEPYTTFLNQCFAAASGEKDNDWFHGWATNTDLETAKRLAVETCTNDGGSNCELFVHICSDNTNYWTSTSQ